MRDILICFLIAIILIFLFQGNKKIIEGKKSKKSKKGKKGKKGFVDRMIDNATDTVNKKMDDVVSKSLDKHIKSGTMRKKYLINVKDNIYLKNQLSGVLLDVNKRMLDPNTEADEGRIKMKTKINRNLRKVAPKLNKAEYNKLIDRYLKITEKLMQETTHPKLMANADAMVGEDQLPPEQVKVINAEFKKIENLRSAQKSLAELIVMSSFYKSNNG